MRRRRPGLYADILVPVLKDPAGEDRGPRGLSNLLKEEDKEEKKDDDDDEEEMKGKRRDKKGYAGQPGGGGGHTSQIAIGAFCHLSPSPAGPASRFFPPRRS